MLILGIALGVLLAALVLTLALADTFSPRGVVFGSFQECGLCPAQEGHALRPWVGVPIYFVRTGTNREYEAKTDTEGNYSISLPVGRYTIRAFYLVGPREVTVKDGQRTEADFIE